LDKYKVMTTLRIHCQISEDLNLLQKCYDNIRSHFYQAGYVKVQKIVSDVYIYPLPQQEKPFLIFYDIACCTYTIKIQGV